MNPATLRPATWVAAAFLAGGLGYLALGPRPPAALSAEPGGSAFEWNLPADDGVRRDGIRAAWSEEDPWAARPVVPEFEAPPPPPPAVPVAIVREGGRWRAVFIHEGAEQRAGAGEALYGGGQVRSVDELKVRWTDAQGETHVRELFADPLPVLGGADANAPAAVPGQ